MAGSGPAADPAILTASSAEVLLAAGSLTCETLTSACLTRIERYEEELQAWETVDAEGALETARSLDIELERTGSRGPLHGIPVGLKDIYYTAGIRTTMSSPIYAGFVPDQDAESVVRLKRAGAVILGKTVTTEFATADPSRTVNPWNAAHTPGGSSSGSAVAVAARMCAIATGSQTAGSVNRPAAYNGVVGFKPTYGRVSRRGVYPVSWTLDTLGWMSRSVSDAAAVLDAVSGYDPGDPASASLPPTDCHSTLETWNGPPRMGIVGAFFERSSTTEVQAHTFSVIEALRTAGAVVEPFVLPGSFIGIRDAQLVIDYAECAAAHREIFRERAEEYAPNVRARIESGALIPAEAYLQAQRLRRKFRDDMDEALGALDAIITPATPTPAPADLSTTGDPMFQSPWTTSGLPVLNLPSGLSSAGLPLGIQLIGRGFGEAGLLRTGRWVEMVLGVELTPPATEDLSSS